MEWRHFSTTYQEGIGLTLQLQAAHTAAYMAHLQAGRGLLPQAAIFARSDAHDDRYDFYFTPQTVDLMGAALNSYQAKPSDAPRRYLADDRNRDRGLSLLIGEAGAWSILADAR